MKKGKIISFEDENFEELYKMPCDSFDSRKQKLIFKALEIREEIKKKRRKENGN